MSWTRIFSLLILSPPSLFNHQSTQHFLPRSAFSFAKYRNKKPSIFLSHHFGLAMKPMFWDFPANPWRGWFSVHEKKSKTTSWGVISRYASLIDFEIAKKAREEKCFQFFNFTSNLACSKWFCSFLRLPSLCWEDGLPLWDFNLKILHCINNRTWWVYQFTNEGIKDWFLQRHIANIAKSLPDMLAILKNHKIS